MSDETSDQMIATEKPPPKPPRHRRHSMLHHAVVALICAVLAYVPIYALRHTALVGGASDAALDFIMRMQADAKTPPPGPDVAVVDIGDAEYVALGRPLVLPRDRLATALDRIAAAKPKLIVLDVDVSWHDEPAREAALHDTFARLKQRGTNVLLIREALPNGNLPPYLRPTPQYDDVVSANGPVRFVSASVVMDSDGVVRRIKPWISYCRDATPAVLPGVHLVAKAILNGGNDGKATLDRSLADNRLPCRPGAANAAKDVGGDRVLYRFSWGAALSPTAAMAVVPAAPLLDDRSKVSPSLFRNRIVIVGASTETLRDVHDTPLGRMPGMFILANAMRGEIAEGAIHESGLWLGLLVAMVMSLVTFGIWALLRRVLNFNVVLLREGLKLGLTFMWGVFAWLFLAHGAALEFAFPQYIVITYLAYSEGFDHII